jgi:hypothetical protein
MLEMTLSLSVHAAVARFGSLGIAEASRPGEARSRPVPTSKEATIHTRPPERCPVTVPEQTHGHPSSPRIISSIHPPSTSELGLGLRLLQDGLHLGRLHDFALDLQLPTHEEPLGVRLAGHQLAEVGVGQREGDCVEDGVLSASTGRKKRKETEEKRKELSPHPVEFGGPGGLLTIRLGPEALANRALLL